MKRILALAISLVIMAVIFSRVDLAAFKSHIADTNAWLMALAMFIFVPQIILFAYRWKKLMHSSQSISLWESTKLTLAASSLNLLLPSKMGDLAKGYFLKKSSDLPLKRGMNLVIFERYLDLLILSLFMIMGFLASASKMELHYAGFFFSLCVFAFIPLFLCFRHMPLLLKIQPVMDDFKEILNNLSQAPSRLISILVLSGLIWVLQIFQFYVIFIALNANLSLGSVFRDIPFCILAGLLPMTVAGIGTRDAALIYFFSPMADTALIAGAGVFASLRYILPGLCGLPYLNTYIVKEKVEGN